MLGKPSAYVSAPMRVGKRRDKLYLHHHLLESSASESCLLLGFYPDITSPTQVLRPKKSQYGVQHAGVKRVGFDTVAAKRFYGIGIDDDEDLRVIIAWTHDQDLTMRYT